MSSRVEKPWWPVKALKRRRKREERFLLSLGWKEKVCVGSVWGEDHALLSTGFMRCVFDSSCDCRACHVACKPPWSFVNLLSELVGQAHREMEELKQVLTASHVEAAN